MGSTPGLDEDRFSDQGEVARGGMSSIHRVFDRETQRVVAVKLVRGETGHGAREHFLAEARIMARLDHPGIVPIYDIARDERGQPARLMMKLVEGKTLAEAIAETAGMPATADVIEPLVRALLRVCEAVSFAHSRGVFHRDLKPGNVMLGSHGQVYTMDWGLALLRGAEGATSTTGDQRASTGGEQPHHHAHEICGTPEYMPPEQARGAIDEIDERSDVFGLGGILYEILTHRPPHRGHSLVETIEAARRCIIMPPDQVAPERNVPAALAAICMHALEADRESRPASVDDFARDVENFLSGGGWFPIERFPAGSLMMRESEPGDCAYILMEGECEVFRTLNGRIEVVRRIGVGQVVGEVALFAPGPRIADVRAVTEVSALVVTRAALDHELVRTPWIGSFLREAAVRYAEAEGLRGKPSGGPASPRIR